MFTHLRELGINVEEPNWETILLDNGQFGGRRFEFDDVHVYWFATRKTLEFYSYDWNPLRTVDATSLAESHPVVQAAG